MLGHNVMRVYGGTSCSAPMTTCTLHHLRMRACFIWCPVVSMTMTSDNGPYQTTSVSGVMNVCMLQPLNECVWSICDCAYISAYHCNSADRFALFRCVTLSLTCPHAAARHHCLSSQRV